MALPEYYRDNPKGIGMATENDIQLRPATSADIPAIIAVTRAAYAPFADRLQPPSSILKETSETVAGSLHNGGIIVAETHGEIVGAVRYEPREDYLCLRRLAVAPSWQGRGIGRRLITAVEEWAILLGVDEVRLGVRPELRRNRAMYARLGYVDDGHAPFRSDLGRHYLRMKKTLRD